MKRETILAIPVGNASTSLRPSRSGKDVENSFDVSAAEYEPWAARHNAEIWGACWPAEPTATSEVANRSDNRQSPFRGPRPKCVFKGKKGRKGMKKMMFLLLVVLPPSAIWAQTKAPAAPNANTQPGQASPKLGANLCGHVMDAGTFIDARAQNASHEEAFVMRWLDPKGTSVHSALFMGRCVAKDGDTIDGKVIVRVLPNSLAVSDRHALTAWEAEFWNSSAEQVRGRTPHRGAFSEVASSRNSIRAKLPSPAASGTDPDFRWNNEEEEILALKPGVVLVPSPLHYTYATAPPPE